MYTPRRKTLCGLVFQKNILFVKRKRDYAHLNFVCFWMGTDSFIQYKNLALWARSEFSGFAI